MPVRYRKEIEEFRSPCIWTLFSNLLRIKPQAALGDPFQYGFREFAGHGFQCIHVDAFHVQLVRSGQCFSQIEGIQDGFFRRGHVEIIDSGEPKKKRWRDFRELDGDALILDLVATAHGRAQGNSRANNRRLPADPMVVQGPLAGYVGRRPQKAGNLLHPWKTVKKGIDVISPIKPVHETLL